MSSPKVIMTRIWMDSKISPKLWGELISAQEFADELMLYTDAYPRGASDRELVTLSFHLPPTMGVAMLRTRLVRGMVAREDADLRGSATV